MTIIMMSNRHLGVQHPPLNGARWTTHTHPHRTPSTKGGSIKASALAPALGSYPMTSAIKAIISNMTAIDRYEVI